MIVYNVPSRTGIGCTLETYAELSKHPNINGVKEASGDLQLVSRTLAECGDNLIIWSGNDSDTLPMMAIGAKGVISVASNIVPEVVARLCSLCLEKNFEEAAKLHLMYTDLFHNLFIEVNPIPVKTAMNLMGMDAGLFRLPLCDMYPSNLEKLKASMLNVGLKIKE
jgi:4-hydroxy-tetrahydrodipicolinate synthase